MALPEECRKVEGFLQEILEEQSEVDNIYRLEDPPCIYLQMKDGTNVILKVE